MIFFSDFRGDDYTRQGNLICKKNTHVHAFTDAILNLHFTGKKVHALHTLAKSLLKLT